MLCRDLKPVIIIEVDDSTHDRASVKKRDEFKDKVFKHVGLPVLRVRRWQGDELEAQIKEALEIKEAGG